MPNHIQNRLTIIGSPERIKEIREFIKSEEQEIDFDKIIPTPAVIKNVGEISHNIVTAVETKYMANISENPLLAIMQLNSRERVKTVKEDQKEDFEKACKAYEETGFVYWYDWNIKNWGTKWGAYDQQDKRNTNNVIFFNTAWSTPRPIIKKLSELFTDVKFELSWADEDSGSNAGTIVAFDGFIKETKFVNQSTNAWNMFFELHPDRKDDYIAVGETYECKEQ